MKLTRSYSTTPDLERRIAKLYRKLYGKDLNRNSELHRRLIEVGLETMETEFEEKRNPRRRTGLRIKGHVIKP